MKSVVVALLVAVSSAGALASGNPNEAGFYLNNTRVNPESGDRTNVSVVNVFYGRYLSERFALTLNYLGVSMGTGVASRRTSHYGVGGKYLYSPGRSGVVVPFVEGQVSFGSTDTGRDSVDSSGLMLGIGASYFLTEAATVDARFQMHKLSGTQGATSVGLRVDMLVVGFSTRF